MLSYITLHPENWPAHSYVALCGTSEQAAIWLLRQYPHLRTVVLCLDADKAGIEGGSRLKESICKAGDYTVREDRPTQKDWNECLKAGHGKEALPAQRHPGVDCIRRLCAALPNANVLLSRGFSLCHAYALGDSMNFFKPVWSIAGCAKYSLSGMSTMLGNFTSVMLPPHSVP